MLTAWDCEKDAIRDFAWQDMRPVPNPATSAAALAARPAPQPAADTRVVCPDCGRRKAKTADDAGRGDCPKWWAINDAMAETDCKLHATPEPSDKIAEFTGAAEMLLSDLEGRSTHLTLIDRWIVANAALQFAADPWAGFRAALRALAGQGETP